MTKVFVSAVIDAPIAKVWAKMRDFNGLPDSAARAFRAVTSKTACGATRSVASATSTSRAAPGRFANGCSRCRTRSTR